MAQPTQANENVKPKNFLENAQDALIRRFSRPAKEVEPVVFEFTNDKALLHQYYRLRDQTFGRDNFHSDGSGGADMHDKISEILVARRGKLLIGACRLTIREGDESFLLPIETESFKLREVFPNIPLNKERHATISKFAILEEHRQYEVMYELCRIVYERAITLDVHYVFSRTTPVLARNWRKIAHIVGATNTRICTEVEVPPIPNFDEKACLVFFDLSDLCLKKFPRVPVPTERKLELIED